MSTIPPPPPITRIRPDGTTYQVQVDWLDMNKDELRQALAILDAEIAVAEAEQGVLKDASEKLKPYDAPGRTIAEATELARRAGEPWAQAENPWAHVEAVLSS